MKLVDKIKQAVKTKKAVLGHKEVLKFLKVSNLDMIILAKDAPEKVKNDVVYNAKIAKTEVEILNKSSVDLGTICGKPFPVSVIGIRGKP
jgi:large subunit ribosomal protein L30e